MLRYWKNVKRYWIDEGAYAHLQMTWPQTLSYAITDSPAGMAAWIVEKWRAWSGWGDDFEKLFSKDELLTNIMLYWINNTFGTAIRIYWESHHHPWKVKPGDRIATPTGVLSFPEDIVPLLKKRVQQYYHVVRFRYMEKGGHFGIFEQAEEYARELRELFRPLR